MESEKLSEINLGFSFDDEEGVGVGGAGGAEFGAGFVEGIGDDREDDAAIGATDEIEAALLLDELEWGGHASGAICVATRSIHGSRWRIKIKVKVKAEIWTCTRSEQMRRRERLTDSDVEFAAIGVAAQAESAEDCCAAAEEWIEDEVAFVGGG